MWLPIHPIPHFDPNVDQKDKPLHNPRQILPNIGNQFTTTTPPLRPGQVLTTTPPVQPPAPTPPRLATTPGIPVTTTPGVIPVASSTSASVPPSTPNAPILKSTTTLASTTSITTTSSPSTSTTNVATTTQQIIPTSLIYVNSFPADFPKETHTYVYHESSGRKYAIIPGNQVADSMTLFGTFFFVSLFITIALIKCVRFMERQKGGVKEDAMMGEGTQTGNAERGEAGVRKGLLVGRGQVDRSVRSERIGRSGRSGHGGKGKELPGIPLLP